MVEYLTKKGGAPEHLPKMGIDLRGRGLNPPNGLKRFIQSHPDKFSYVEECVAAGIVLS